MTKILTVLAENGGCNFIFIQSHQNKPTFADVFLIKNLSLKKPESSRGQKR
jgi:hypothetical protein